MNLEILCTLFTVRYSLSTKNNNSHSINFRELPGNREIRESFHLRKISAMTPLTEEGVQFINLQTHLFTVTMVTSTK